MREVLVAVFDTVQNTETAIHALQEAGIPISAIRRCSKDDPAIPATAHTPVERREDHHREDHTQSSGGFWAWLLGEEGHTTEYDRDYPTYGRAVESGNTVLAVTVEQADVQRIMTLLANHMPVELDDAGPVTTDPVPQRARDDLAARQVGETPIGKAHQVGESSREQVVPLVEENVSIGTRKVDTGATRIRRYVVNEPVEKTVTLHDEHVEVERRAPTTTRPDGSTFQERTVEVHDTTEVPVVQKSARVGEEVVVRKETTERPETVRETVRREEADIQRSPRSNNA